MVYSSRIGIASPAICWTSSAAKQSQALPVYGLEATTTCSMVMGVVCLMAVSSFLDGVYLNMVLIASILRIFTPGTGRSEDPVFPQAGTTLFAASRMM